MSGKTGYKYYAIFSCGHKGYIYYHTKTELYEKIAAAEKTGLCPECKVNELKASSVLVKMPYGEYKSYYSKKRGVATGKYDAQSKLIEVYMPQKLASRYELLKNSAYYDAVFVGKDENSNIVIALFVKGNSFKLKEELKKIGYVWKHKRWQKEIVVFPTLLSDDRKWFDPKNNPEFYSETEKLKSLGCKEDLKSLEI